MKVINVLYELAMGTLPEGFEFYIGDDRFIYTIGIDGYLYFSKLGDYKIPVEWNIYKSWLNQEIQIVKDDEE